VSKHSTAPTREAIEINSSHMALKHCVRSMAENRHTEVSPADERLTPESDCATVQPKSKHVPYRMNILTRVLKDCLWSANSRAIVIATVSPIPTDTEHTIQTLQYASLMACDIQDASKKERHEVQRKRQSSGKVPIAKWSKDECMKWIMGLEKGKFEVYASGFKSLIDGKQLTRLSLQRISQMCKYNRNDAEILYNAVRKQILKERAMKSKTVRSSARR